MKWKRMANSPAKTFASLLFLSIAVLVTATASWADTSPNRSERGDLPGDAPKELKRLVGEYSSAQTGDDGPDETRLTIGEAGGKLFAEGLGLHSEPLRRLDAARFSVVGSEGQSTRLDFELDRGQRVSAVILRGARLPLRDIGLEVMEMIRAGVNADPARLRKVALAAKPPIEPAPKREFDLLNLAAVDPTIKFDIRYASSNNFIGFALYEWPAAYLQRPVAEALGRVQRALAPKGYGLLIHDGYRPWFVTKMFWDATPERAHVFVADPSKGSRHNRGCAVDLTLYDLKSGRTVEMTGRYDEMSRRSYADYVGGTSRQRWLRDLLRSEMEAQGFAVYPEEWWHYDYKDWGDYGIGKATFSQLDAAQHSPSP
ncbi:MAG: M15 family metallopeptidase [Pseudomonadota bacterium]|nr:M15 family metallopeptidase [Pseudomonadota bacterium]